MISQTAQIVCNRNAIGVESTKWIKPLVVLSFA